MSALTLLAALMRLSMGLTLSAHVDSDGGLHSEGVVVQEKISQSLSHSLSYQYGSDSTRTDPTLLEWVSSTLFQLGGLV